MNTFQNSGESRAESQIRRGESRVPDAEATNEPFPEGVPLAHRVEPPAHVPTPLMAVRPPREIPPPIEIFDPIQPIDLMSRAERRRFAAKSPSALAAGRPFSGLERQRRPQTVRLADVPMHDVDWLWPGRVPIGKVTLLVGDPGVGKSLIALDIAARVTRAAPWPDEAGGTPGASSDGRGCSVTTAPETTTSFAEPQDVPPKPGSVLLLSAEDDLADTIRPRLEALGADCTRIIALAAAETSSPSLLTPDSRLPAPSTLDLGRDISLLDRVLDSLPDCRLVIVDPISAYLGRAVENINAEVRRIIAPLAELAARRRLALVAISHLRKQQGAAIHRSMGRLAFVAAARAAWLVVKDPNDPARRLLLPMKNNLAGDATGLACTIEPRSPDASPNTSPIASPIIRWSPEPIDMAADAALAPTKRATGRPSDERDEATRWLVQQLASGAQPSLEVEELAAAIGFKLPTLRRAFRDLGGEAVRIGFSPGSRWLWRLPAVDAQNSPPTSEHLRPDPRENDARTDC